MFLKFEQKGCFNRQPFVFSEVECLANPITNSACFTPITDTTASWLTVVFRYDPATKTMIPTGNGVIESNGATAGNYKDMQKWFDNLMADTFS